MKPASLRINAGKEGVKQTGPKRENETDNDRETEERGSERGRDRQTDRDDIYRQTGTDRERRRRIEPQRERETD